MNNEKENRPCEEDPRKPNECIACHIINFCPSPKDKEAVEWKKDRGVK